MQWIYASRLLLDPRPLEQMVEHGVDWMMLHGNLQSGRAHALLVPALHVI